MKKHLALDPDRRAGGFGRTTHLSPLGLAKRLAQSLPWFPLALMLALGFAGPLPLIAASAPESDAQSDAQSDAETAMTLPAVNAQAAAEQRACLRCHGMATMAYRDPESGEIVSLVVDQKAFNHSVHGDQPCSQCHADGYLDYPHAPEQPASELSCVQCHEDHPENTDRVNFTVIEREYQASVHALSDDPEAEGFHCHSCHDPHVFRASLLGRDIPEIVAYDNQICLSCHEQLRDPLSESHAWLPNRDKHWASVRCLECHTPLSDNGRPVSHEILSAENSNVNCVECHSQGQGLLSRLYQYRSREDIEKQGFFAKAVFNEAYVVGMSRNPLIDRLALFILGLTVLVLAAHGYGRYRAYQALREQQSTAADEGDKQ
ncbi:decaheme c-type cytochrome, DmsE family [Thiorhodovibrio winogradskyi]|uniref:Decaheme c-type cytochrome, DmsE family n=2 Tax=Thiorhodovibrio winogradskyi TaxID=77007 RepID=A0ABZ0SAK9_9GAMM